ncbi:hypothetical protein FRC14_008136 [Serendipita sp. 396]|nr:hypothetical protein FRC14_008136 [Serendipita sp. 396]
MDKDSVVAQLAVIHIYKDMCRFSEEPAPDNAWISPKAEEETTLREQLVETYKSSGPGSMYDKMSLYRYSKEEITLPRTTACDVVIGALTEIYGS